MMDITMRDEIEHYIDNSFPTELGDEFRASLMVFDAFDFGKPYEVLPDILFDTESEDADLTRLKFAGMMESLLDDVFQAHQIVTVDDTDVQTKNLILGVLFRLQDIEDPTPVLRVLETMLSDEEKFAKIISFYSSLDETAVLMAIESVAESTLKTLQEYLYTKEQAIDDVENEGSDFSGSLLRENLIDFFHACGSDNLGHEMIENGIKPGQVSRLYYPYVKEMLVSEDDLQTAKNLLSFLFISSDTFNDPIQTYRKVSEQLIHGVERIVKIEAKMSELLNKLRQYQKAKNDAKSISVVQHPA